MTAAFYDERLPGVLESEDRYAALYDAAMQLVPFGSSVVELGCGAGVFAALLLEGSRVSSYRGIDFAPETTAAATRRVGQDLFEVADLRTCRIPPAETYVALEVLEHLDDDLALLQRLPRGAQVVVSVPSFPSATHVRWFSEPGSARERYAAKLTIDHLQYVLLPNGAFFHLLRGAVR